MTRFLRLLYVLIGSMLMLAPPLAGTAMAGTPLPTINLPSDKSLKCIQPTEEMRKNHMNYIMHQRDITMHDGIRTENNSLTGCIDCHVEPDSEGNIADFHSKEHFCTTCHEYTSVQIDCFQCHADRPQKYINRDVSTSDLTQQLQEKLAAHNASNIENSEKEVNQ